MYEWLNGYVSMYSFVDPATYRANIYRLFTRHILAMFSLSFVLLGILGIASRRISKSEVAKERGSSFLPRRISIHFLLQFSAALLEIILERKMLLYHFTRAFWAFTPFVAQGIYFFAAYFKSRWKETSGFGYSWKFINRALLVTGVFFFALYSPRGKVYESSFTFSYQKILHPEQPTIAFERTHPMTLSNDFAQIKALVLPTLRDSDRIFLWATHIGLFYHLNRLPPTIMLSDIQISSKWTSARLKEQVLSGLKAVSPRYIFVQQNDYLGFLTGIEGDSYASLVGWYDLFEFVDIYYEEKERTENYIIFERRKPEDVIAPL
jgi:hypothetical protein